MDMELEGRVPPHSEDAEKSLLGAMMLSREAVMMAVETLVPDDFYSSVHRAIFSAMCALYAPCSSAFRTCRRSRQSCFPPRSSDKPAPLCTG